MADDRDARIAQLEAELRQRDRALAEALEQQTVTAEVLRVIATSPTGLPKVFEAIMATARRLCHAEMSVIMMRDGQRDLRFLAHSDPTQVGRTRPFNQTVNGRALREARTVHAAEPEPEHLALYPNSRMFRLGFRAQVVTPLLRDDVAVAASGG